MALGLLGVGLTACVSEKTEQTRLGSRAKISRPEAEKIALARVPRGKVKDAELEEEKDKLIWSFDIATPGTKDITEVHVNALTGEIISVENETPASEKKEKENDEKEKRENRK